MALEIKEFVGHKVIETKEQSQTIKSTKKKKPIKDKK